MVAQLHSNELNVRCGRKPSKWVRQVRTFIYLWSLKVTNIQRYLAGSTKLDIIEVQLRSLKSKKIRESRKENVFKEIWAKVFFLNSPKRFFQKMKKSLTLTSKNVFFLFVFLPKPYLTYYVPMTRYVLNPLCKSSTNFTIIFLFPHFCIGVLIFSFNVISLLPRLCQHVRNFP